jgi:hypothetical protein
MTKIPENSVVLKELRLREEQVGRTPKVLPAPHQADSSGMRGRVALGPGQAGCIRDLAQRSELCAGTRGCLYVTSGQLLSSLDLSKMSDDLFPKPWGL